MNVTQTYQKDLWLWRPKTKRIFDNDLWASSTQIDGKAKVSIPATSKAVNRTNGYAAYLRAPFYLSPTKAIIPALSQATRASQPYPDADGNVTKRVAAIYSASQQVITSDGNPSPPPLFPLDVNSILLVEGSINNGGVPSTPAIVSPLATLAVKPIVGALGKAVVGRATNSNVQNLWFVGGNSSFGSTAIYTPKTGMDFVQVTQNVDNTLTVSSTLIGTANRLFPTCCVIEGERYLDQLFYTGGMTSWTALSTGTIICKPNGTVTTATACPESMTQASAISLPYPNSLSGAVTSDYVLVTGGLNSGLNSSKTSVFLFDPYLGTWNTSSSPLITARRDHKSIRIDIQKTLTRSVLIVGGKTGVFSNVGQIAPGPGPIGIPLNQCEIIDAPSSAPSGGAVTLTPRKTGSMADARYAFGMTKLGDGRILVCGGIGYNPTYPIASNTVNEYTYELNRCEIYDPETEIWSPIQSMLEPHSYCTCHYVPQANKVYVYGGYTSKLIEYLDLDTMVWHNSCHTMSTPVVAGSAFGTASGFMGLIGGGHYDTALGTYTPNGSPGYSWNAVSPNVPEYARYDGLNAEWRVDSYDSNTDTLYLTSNAIGNYTNTNVRWSDAASDSQGASFVLAKAVPSSDIDIIGPYIFDLTQPFAISGTVLILNQEVYKGLSYNALTVTAGATSVGSGWIVLNYGYASQEGPIRCLGANDDLTLEIDAGYKFKNNLGYGSVINVLFQRAAFEPESPVGSFWVTASNAGRAAAIDFLGQISAAGIELDITTRYPGDRGLGAEGLPTKDNYKLSDLVEIFGRDDVDQELEEARGLD
jgi:hypothetical protein